MTKSLMNYLTRSLLSPLFYGFRNRHRTYVWDGIIKTAPLQIYEHVIQERTELFARAKAGDWTAVLAALPDELHRFEAVSGTRNLFITEPDDFSLNTLLHYATLTNAPADVVNHFVRMGASRMRRNAKGQRAVDIARENGYEALVQLLEPKLSHTIPAETIQKIETHFHKMIDYPPNDPYQLPQIDVLLEEGYGAIYFPIIGSYGGHRHWFDYDAREPTLVVFRECRIAAGSEILHKITIKGVETVATGRDVFKYKLK